MVFCNELVFAVHIHMCLDSTDFGHTKFDELYFLENRHFN